VRIKDNIIFQYTISTAIVVIAVSFILGFTLTRWTADLQIKKHIDLYPQIVSEHLKEHSDILDYIQSSNHTETPEQIEEFIEGLKYFGRIFRVKIWGDNARVLWSDDASIVGKRFPENVQYLAAWKGKIVYKTTKPQKAEQATEADHKQVLEIYTPASHNRKIIAVIELYEATDILFEEIQKSAIFIWILVSFSGLITYALLFYIFYSSHIRQKQIISELSRVQDVTIMSLAAVAETRDNETGAHILRTQRYVRLLAEKLRHKKKFKRYLNSEYIKILYKSSPLHDIGKVGVPDSILLKPGKLTAEEFEEMKKHTAYGRDSLRFSEEKLGSNSFLETAREIAYTHHEKWNGSGYPNGLIGEEIPISGRIMALADVYDALISQRVYKEAFSHEYAREIIMKGRGNHFDPEIVDAFMELEKVFNKVAMEFRD
jgi:HD-GYP domain-containing protein (c-di-GMP phosphodiesterase class II)